MANSKYEYVKEFERPDNLLPNTWIVIRLDGRGFHKFSTRHNFIKPNDHRAISLMNAAAVSLLQELPDILIAYGVSDEFSFLLPPNCTLFERREAKLTSTIVSTFTAYYVNRWPEFFPDESLKEPLPSFDARAVCYPSMKNIRDYFSWRQVDCHINNLYNTTFWGLVTEGVGRREAEEKLKGTYSKDKHEMLFQMGINYNNEAEVWKKGSVVFRELNGTVIRTNEIVETTGVTATDMIISIKTGIKDSTPFHSGDSSSQATISISPKTMVIEEKEEEEKNPQGKILKKTKKTTKKQVKKEQKRLLKAAKIVVAHIDIIEDKFWIEHPYILGEGTD